MSSVVRYTPSTILVLTSPASPGCRKVKLFSIVYVKGRIIWDYLCFLLATYHHFMIFLVFFFFTMNWISVCSSLCANSCICDGIKWKLWGEERKKNWMNMKRSRKGSERNWWPGKVSRGCTCWLVALLKPCMFLHCIADEALYFSYAVILTPPFFGWFFCTWLFISPLSKIINVLMDCVSLSGCCLLKIIQDFDLPSVVMRPCTSSCYMFSFIHVSQHVLLLVQDRKATLCQVENLPNDLSLDAV